MVESVDNGPPLVLRFVFTFASYVVYVLFRRLPMVVLPQVQKEIRLDREDIGELLTLHWSVCINSYQACAAVMHELDDTVSNSCSQL